MLNLLQSTKRPVILFWRGKRGLSWAFPYLFVQIRHRKIFLMAARRAWHHPRLKWYTHDDAEAWFGVRKGWSAVGMTDTMTVTWETRR